MKLYDTHAHLNDEAFREDTKKTVARAEEAGVRLMNIVGCDPESSAEAVAMAHAYEIVRAVVGIHPSDGDRYDEAFESRLKQWAKDEKVVAVGEIGLDYHYEDDVPHDIQRDVFRRQLRLAGALDLPVVIHCRDAMSDTLAILREENEKVPLRGVFHCFSGSYEQALDCLELGFYIGFDGPLTFKNAKKPVRVATRIPLDRILIETDCPYMAPEPVRGRRNEPANVRHIAAKLGEIRGISTEEAAEITYANGCRLFMGGSR